MGAPQYNRSHKVTWEDPAAARAQMAELTGLEIMESVRDGRLAEPPMARLIDFRCVSVKPGEVMLELQPHEALENYMGMLHGAAAATLLDTAMTFFAASAADNSVAVLKLHCDFAKALLLLSLICLQEMMPRSGDGR